MDANPNDAGNAWVSAFDSVPMRDNPPHPGSRPITGCMVRNVQPTGNFGWQHATCSNKFSAICWY